ncbi:MAG TPA: serine protease [Planctomycetota bacterium]|jgi:S1-C subfamily serine protease
MSGRIASAAVLLGAAALIIYASRPSTDPQRSALEAELVREREDNSRRLAAIGDRLDRLDVRLARPDGAFEDLGKRMDAVAVEVAGTDGSLRGLRDAVARLKKDASRDAALLDRSILRPSVQVCGHGSVGGGTLIRSERDADGAFGTYILTALHVVRKSGDRETTPPAPRPPVQVKIYGESGEPESAEGDLVLQDERRDLALLKMRTTRRYPVAARLASRERVRETTVFTPIYTVGCPLGHDPLPSFGEITTLHKEVNGERFWMMSAPTIFGNSGGGVFHRETLELIGVSAMICTFDNPVSTPVPHLGILVPLDSVFDWLRDNKYAFLYDVTAAAPGPDSGSASAVPASAREKK